MTEPLVSCVMPTRNRRRFVSQAIWYFLRQDLNERELVVVDDGEDAISDLVPSEERIRYVRLESRTPLGAKRNLACKHARGEFIAHWDDDDWFAPARLDAQVSALERSGCDACGAAELLHYRLEAGDAWSCRYGVPNRPPVAGGTLLYRRSAWAEHPFADVDVGEESAFLAALGPARVHAMSGTPLQIAIVHSANAAAQNLGQRFWTKRPLDEVVRPLGPDLDFYVGLRNGGAASPAHRAAAPRVTVSSCFMVWDGYGNMAEYLVRSIARAGVRVDVDPLAIDANGLSEEFQALRRDSRPDPASPALWFSPPIGAHERFPSASDLLINTMWESDRLPAGWVAALNRARLVVVPSRFCARVFRDEGVTVPIEVVPQGVDPDVYAFVQRPARPGLTTLIVAPPVPRKHVTEGVAAWHRAFEGDPHARLIVKAKFGLRDVNIHDPRISVMSETETSRGIAHWYRRADVLLALGNEGFGLPLVEGMATGLPVVALMTEGQADVCEDARDLVLPVPAERREPCTDTHWGRVGMRGVPSVAAVADRLRWVADHPDEARSLGRAASGWALRERNVWSMGPSMLDAMESHMPGRPLRRRRALWAPGRSGTQSRECAAELAAAAADVRLVRRPPEAPTSRLLHVMHEEGALPDGELTARILEARANGLPVAVTQHGVAGRIRAWERDADVLVVTRAEAASAARRRWPAKWVEYIPPGCPIWFPRRKAATGQVIAAIAAATPGQPEAILLELVGRRTGAELLLFGPSPSPGAGERTGGRRGHARVRRIDPGLTGRALARRLASEADVVAVPDTAGEAWPVHVAVRTAIASGVPVAAGDGDLSGLEAATHRAANLGDAIAALLDDRVLANTVSERARDFCNERSWARIAERHVALWNVLEHG